MTATEYVEKTQKDYETFNPIVLNDNRVMLSLDIDDIKMKCKELKIRQKDIDFEKVFYRARKYMEDSMMDQFWDCLVEAINDSPKKDVQQ